MYNCGFNITFIYTMQCFLPHIYGGKFNNQFTKPKLKLKTLNI